LCWNGLATPKGDTEMEVLKMATAEASVDAVEMVPVQPGSEDVSADALAARAGPGCVVQSERGFNWVIGALPAAVTGQDG